MPDFKSLIEIRNRLLSVADSILFPEALPPGPSRGIFVARLDALGDFLLWLPFARLLRKNFPNEPITLLANAHWAPFAESLGIADQVIPLNRKAFLNRPLYRFSILRTLRKSKFRWAFSPTYSRYAPVDDAVLKTVFSEKKFGFDTNNEANDSWMNHKVRRVPPFSHELEKNFQFMKETLIPEVKWDQIGFQDFPRSPSPTPSLPPRPYYILHLGAGSSERIWPVENFAKVATWLSQKTGLLCVLTGTDDELERARTFSQLTQCPFDSQIGKWTLEELPALLLGSQFILSNDTSILHYGVLLGKPAVALAAGGQYGRFIPYPTDIQGVNPPQVITHSMDCFGCDWNCVFPKNLRSPVPCLSRVTPEETILQIEKWLPTLSLPS